VTDPLRDPMSGLLSEDFFREALPHRVAVARRLLRPLSIALVTVGPSAGDLHAPPSMIVAAAGAIESTLREADLACRFGAGFGLLLEDTPENGAVWTCERLRRRLPGVISGSTGHLWAGVAAYPAHGLEAGELLRRAEDALDAARQWTSQTRIEVALTL
jgi:hypothetical protein